MLGTYTALLSSSSVCRLSPASRMSACMVLLPASKAPLKPQQYRSLACAAARRSTQPPSIEQLDEHQVVVVGGGAAGLTAAYFAAKGGAKVREDITRGHQTKIANQKCQCSSMVCTNVQK
jgi:heterodisulfide reductase subunit A-like polyferredoxin